MIGVVMRRHVIWVLAVLVLWVGRAKADDPPPADAPVPASAPASGPTVIEGRATDVLGKPIPNARVYVLPRGRQPIQSKTDKLTRIAEKRIQGIDLRS